MSRLFSLLSVVVLAAFAAPAGAQQDQQPGEKQPALEYEAPAAETGGVTERQGIEDQQAGQVTERTAAGTEREMAGEGEAAEPEITPEAGAAPGAGREPIAERGPGLAQPGAETQPAGAEMPTTASPLPWLALAGAGLVAVAVGLRVLQKTS